MNRRASDYIFTTEGHIIKVDPTLRVKPWKDIGECFDDDSTYAIAKMNESFITHSVSSCTYISHVVLDVLVPHFSS